MLSRARDLLSGNADATTIQEYILNVATSLPNKLTTEDFQILGDLIERSSASEHSVALIAQLLKQGCSLHLLAGAFSVLIESPRECTERIVDCLGPEHVDQGLFSYLSLFQSFHPVLLSARQLCERVLRTTISVDAVSHYLEIALLSSTEEFADCIDFFRSLCSTSSETPASEADEPSANLDQFIHAMTYVEPPLYLAFVDKARKSLFRGVGSLLFDLALVACLWDSSDYLWKDKALCYLGSAVDEASMWASLASSWDLFSQRASLQSLPLLCWALVMSYTASRVSAGIYFLARLSQSPRSSNSSNAAALLVEAAFAPVRGFGEHRMFSSALALLQLPPDIIQLESLVRWLDFWCESSPPYEQHHNFELDDRSRILLIYSLCCLIAPILQRSSEPPTMLIREYMSARAVNPWKQLTYYLFKLALSGNDTSSAPRIEPGEQESIAIPQLAFLMSLNVPIDIRQLCSRWNFEFEQLSSSWSQLVIYLAQQLSSVQYQSEEVIEGIISLALASKEHHLSEDVLESLDDDEIVGSRYHQCWIWVILASAAARECLASEAVGGECWSIFSMAIRRAYKLVFALPPDSHQQNLMRSLSALSAGFRQEHLLAVLQLMILGDAADTGDSDLAYNRVFLCEWVIQHYISLLDWLLSSPTDQVTPRPPTAPLNFPFFLRPSIDQLIRFRLIENVIERDSMWGQLVEDQDGWTMIPTALIYLTHKLCKMSSVSEQSKTAEQARYVASITSVILGCICLLQIIWRRYKQDNQEAAFSQQFDRVAADAASLGIDQAIPDPKLEIFRLFWLTKHSIIRLGLICVLKEMAAPAEVAALFVWLTRNSNPLPDLLDQSEVGFSSSALLPIICGTSKMAHSSDIESLVITETISLLVQSDFFTSVGYMCDVISSVEHAITEELKGRICRCKYRFLAIERLPQLSFQLGHMCLSLWRHDRALDAANELSCCTWRILLLVLLALSDPLLDNSNSFDIRTLRTQFVGPVVQRMSQFVHDHEFSSEHMLIFGFLFEALTDAMSKDADSRRVFRISKKGQTVAYAKANQNLQTSLLDKVKSLRKENSDGVIRQWSQIVVEQLAWSEIVETNDQEEVTTSSLLTLPWLDRAITPSVEHLRALRHFVNSGLMTLRGDHIAEDSSEIDYSLEESDASENSYSGDESEAQRDQKDEIIIRDTASLFFADAPNFE